MKYKSGYNENGFRYPLFNITEMFAGLMVSDWLGVADISNFIGRFSINLPATKGKLLKNNLQQI